MILLDSVLKTAIQPGLALLPSKMDTPAAQVMLLAIGLQESRLMFRFQKTNQPYVKGPARGLWQNERGGVQAVMGNPATKEHAEAVVKACKLPWDSSQVHAAMEFDDRLAAAFARLFLWADPKPLPPVDADHETAWQTYARCWRPGKPHRETWDQFHAQAQGQVMA